MPWVAMRVLFTFAGGSGHADPLVPVAVAARSAGHDVAFAGRRSAAGTVEANGFALFARPADPSDDPPTITPLLEIDMEREYRVLREYYAGRLARERATRVLDVCAEWRPDVIVCDEVDFGSMIAAERLGLPHATVLVTASGSFVRAEVVAGALDAVRAEQGLAPDPSLGMPSRHLVISPIPPSFRDPAFPLPKNALSIRPDEIAKARAAVERSSDLPTVYFTLGTVFNMESGDLFERVLTGLRDLPLHLIVTVGRELDPESFGLQPSNVRIERYIRQWDVLPQCDVVVNHGGSGSVIGALAHGLPMVVLAMGADQSLNAGRCQALGVGIALDGARASPRSVGEAVTTILSDQSYRVAAEAIRDEIAALPGPAAAVSLLEELVGHEPNGTLRTRR
jgi:UDP:flavonoid glycosyltransferase YjiC (YdhE family)